MGPTDVFSNFKNCTTDSITCVYVQYNSKNVKTVNTPFKFNGTSLVRINKNPIPLGIYTYQVFCKYNLEVTQYKSELQTFEVIDYCETEQGPASYKLNGYFTKSVMQ